MLVKILGLIDLLSAFTLLMIIFNVHPFIQLILFCSGILMLKGLFVFTGNVLSALDLLISIILMLSMFITLPAVILWAPAFLLLAKGIASLI